MLIDVEECPFRFTRGAMKTKSLSWCVAHYAQEVLLQSKQAQQSNISAHEAQKLNGRRILIPTCHRLEKRWGSGRDTVLNISLAR